MSATFTPNDSTSRPRRQLETDRRQIEAPRARACGGLASGALRSIETDTAEATGRRRALLPGAWLRHLVVGLSRFLGRRRMSFGRATYSL